MKGYPSVLSPTEIRFERLLPGPIENVWTYLTDEKKRGEWLASGPMDGWVGGKVKLRFKHADLSPNQAPAPETYKKMDLEGHSAEETVTGFDPPHRLAFTWGEDSEVVFELTPKDGKVLLTLTHRKLPTVAERDGNAAGWHCHLTVLVDKLEGRIPPAFWDIFRRVSADYANGIPR
jgi:uncharacterized protein YndB with AHSA1/START domain